MTTKILIIEDEAVMRRNLADVLALEGFEVLAAADGFQGVEMARRFHPDIIVCDILMPDMDGYAVLATLRLEKGTAKTPFIFLTAKGDRSDIRTGMNLGADDYLIKPVPLDELLGAIRARLQRTRDRQVERPPVTFESAKPLEALGLSPREAEVLLWTAQGKTNDEISVILNVSCATVKKHLENIFRKTGTERRTAASLLAMETLSRGMADPTTAPQS